MIKKNFFLRLFFFLFIIIQTKTGFSVQETEIYFFYSPDCQECLKTKQLFLIPLQEKYPFIKIEYYDLNIKENYYYLVNLEKKYDCQTQNPPIVFVNGRFLQGAREIEENLEKIIFTQDSQSIQKPPPTEEIKSEKIEIPLLSSVIISGLFDGINPCAFVTIIFLIAYLSFVGKTKKEIFLYGSIFIIAVWVVYFLIGVGLLKFISTFSLYPLISQVFRWIIFLVVCSLGIINLYDYFQVKKGNPQKIKLQLPTKMKKGIHATFHKTKNAGLISASLISGFLVAAIEFPCTGQIYFPITFLIQESTSYRFRGIFYLIIYNIMFIIPLLIIFILVGKGLTSENLNQFFKKNLGKVKLGMSILFFALAGVLFI